MHYTLHYQLFDDFCMFKIEFLALGIPSEALHPLSHWTSRSRHFQSILKAKLNGILTVKTSSNPGPKTQTQKKKLQVVKTSKTYGPFHLQFLQFGKLNEMKKKKKKQLLGLAEAVFRSLRASRLGITVSRHSSAACARALRCHGPPSVRRGFSMHDWEQ